MSQTKLIVFFTAVVIMVPLISFIILDNRHPVTVMKIELTNQPDNHLKNQELYNKLTEIENKMNDRSLIEIFDSEREKYNQILTLIAVIISIFGLYTIVLRLVEKNDFDKLKEEFTDINNKNINLNKLLTIGYLRSELTQLTDAFIHSSTLVFRNNGLKVSNKDEFLLYLEVQYTNYFTLLKNGNAVDEISFDEIAIPFSRSLMHAAYYACDRSYSDEKSLYRSKNMIIEKILTLCKAILGNETYSVFETSIKKHYSSFFVDELIGEDA